MKKNPIEYGRTSCDGWLNAHFGDLGARSTVDLRLMFEGEVGPLGAARGAKGHS